MTALTQPPVHLVDNIHFLSSPDAYPHHPRQVKAIETHMSWVFLTGSLVYKLKKPVRYSFLDFTTLASRKRHSATELRLNRRLARESYRRLIGLRIDDVGRLTLGGSGDIVEWLIEMEQLPASEMLDSRIRAGGVGTEDIIAVGERLARFYAAAAPQVADGGAYLVHLQEETAISREQLPRSGCGLPPDRIEAILDRTERLLEHWSSAILDRVANGRIIEGHGDLRPEHVCLQRPPVIIDCLEFDRNMRLLDPYDEISYLGLECQVLGAGWIRPLLLAVLDDLLGDRPDPRLVATYGAFRCVLRSRICMAHLLDPEPMEPERWPGEARAYLAMAEEECRKAEG